ncbi:MAG: hypothetical protein EOP84_11025 [Verrucomicrobiaceae bacterium]|nr:MAG: hypothetical protein EOP84_11025 [Verrucomicrobiaceae bacterium]
MKGKTRALITHGAIWSGDGLDSSRLKSTTLLFDEVTFVGPKMDVKWQSLIEEEGLSPKARSVLIENWSDNSGAPEYQLYEEHNWPWDHGPEVLKAATKTVLSEEYGSEFPASYDGYKYGG